MTKDTLVMIPRFTGKKDGCFIQSVVFNKSSVTLLESILYRLWMA